MLLLDSDYEPLSTLILATTSLMLRGLHVVLRCKY